MSEKLNLFPFVCKATAKSSSLPICTVHVGSRDGLGLLDIGVSAGSVTVSSVKPEGSRRFLALIRKPNLALADVAGVRDGTRSGIGGTISGPIISCHGCGVGLAPGKGIGSARPVGVLVPSAIVGSPTGRNEEWQNG